MEPRKVTDRGADVVNWTEGNTECVVVAGCIRSAGVEEQSMFARGVAEEPGRSRRLHGLNPLPRLPLTTSISIFCAKRIEEPVRTELQALTR